MEKFLIFYFPKERKNKNLKSFFFAGRTAKIRKISNNFQIFSKFNFSILIRIASLFRFCFKMSI